MRVKPALLLILLGLAVVGCGRKDLPDYPPDAVERPGTLQRRTEPVRYY